MTTISVVVPTYNRANELRNCLTSVLEQDGADHIEVVVVDDGSTDDTRAVVEAFGARNVRYLRQANAGPCVARNRGAERAIGRFLAFLDSDDELAAGWAREMTRLLEHDRTAIACCGVTLVTNEGPRTTHLPAPAGPAYGDRSVSFMPGAYAVSRELFHRTGGFAEDIAYGEHHELGLRLTSLLPKDASAVRSVGRPLVVKHHDRSPAVTFRYHRQRLEAVERMVERHAAQLGSDRSLLADYEGVAAFSAASLGEYRRARCHYLRAIRASPTRWKPYLGFTSATVPGVRRTLWSVRSGRMGPSVAARPPSDVASRL
jgi:glycosyltransferase involved in cell wall biosynthesis